MSKPIEDVINSEKIIITDDKGVEREFTSFTDLVEFLNNFLMPFLPDNFSYRIEDKANE